MQESQSGFDRLSESPSVLANHQKSKRCSVAEMLQASFVMKLLKKLQRTLPQHLIRQICAFARWQNQTESLQLAPHWVVP